MIDLPPLDPAIEFSVASRGMSKGIAQSEGPQAVAKGSVHAGVIQVGAQWKNVTSRVAGGEGAIFMQVSPKLGQFQFTLSAAHKFQTRVREPADDHSWEFSGAVSRKFGKLALRGSLIYSPDDLGGARRSFYWEGGPTLEIGKSTRLLATVGRRHRANAPDYTSFSAGISRTVFKGVSADLRWYDTSRHQLGENFGGRAVVSTRLAF
jgi:hypothetical protein